LETNLLTKQCILLVDDDRLILTSLKEGLSKAGYLVETAESVNEAEMWLDQHKTPDLVMLDMRMPDRLGIELSTKLKELQNIPFILLTAFSEQEVIDLAKSTGAMGYLVKPVSIAQVIPAIQTAIARSEDLKKLHYNQRMLQTALDGDRAVSVAVGIVMDRHHVNHDEAFELLRKKARSSHSKLIEVASSIVNACESLNIDIVKKPEKKMA